MRSLRTVRPVLVALALAGLLSACGSWRGSRQAPLPELPAVTGGATARALWNVSVGRGGTGFAPVFAEGSVWAASADGNVLRLDAETGRVVWRTALGRSLSAGVGTDGRTVVAATREGEIVALDEQGRERWRTPLGVEVASVPSVGPDLVLVRAVDNRVFALSLADGTRRWLAQRANPPLVLRQTASVATDGRLAYVGMPGGRLLALGLDGGTPRWEIAVAQPRGATEIERIADVVGTPLVAGDEVCAVTYQGRLGCFDAASGTQRWARPFSSTSGLEVDGRAVYAVDADSAVHAFSRSGASLWKQDRLARRELSAPLSIGRVLVMGDRQGLVHVLSRDDGRILARAATDGSAPSAPPVEGGAFTYVQTRNGNLHAFRIE